MRIPTLSPTALLASYQVSPERGFLAQAVLEGRLSGKLGMWEEIAANLPALIRRGTLRAKVEALPLLSPLGLQTPPQQERALLILSLLAHAYLHLPGGEPVSVLPASLAHPWAQLSDAMKRPAILHHASYVLNNWTFVDPAKGFEPENLRPRLSFLDTADERWFITITAAVEGKGGLALLLALQAHEALRQQDPARLSALLSRLAPQIDALTALLDRMIEACRPEVFYAEIRPFLNGVAALTYAGAEPAVRTYAGGSAAQSTLIQALDCLLGITHEAPYLRQMRAYMPVSHRKLLVALPSLSQQSLPATAQASYQAAVVALRDFRTAHLKLAARYILQQQAQQGATALGTGGTTLLPFLKGLRNETKARD